MASASSKLGVVSKATTSGPASTRDFESPTMKTP